MATAVAAAARRIRSSKAGRRIKVRLPEGEPLMPIEATAAGGGRSAKGNPIQRAKQRGTYTEVNLEIDHKFRRHPFQFQIPIFVYAAIKSARELATSLQSFSLFLNMESTAIVAFSEGSLQRLIAKLNEYSGFIIFK